jgi:predicted O-methyltransferase YrrM
MVAEPADKDMTPAQKLCKAFGYLTMEEVGAIKKLAKDLPDRALCVNIGAGVGTSALALLETRRDVRLITVDITMGPHPHGGLVNETTALDQAEIAYKNRYRQICGDSVEVADQVEHKVDYVFVDGCHTYEHARDDIETWASKINDGGVIAVHDYCLHERFKTRDMKYHWPEVKLAVDDTIIAWGWEEILHIDSIGAWRVNHSEGFHSLRRKPD